MIAVIYSQI